MTAPRLPVPFDFRNPDYPAVYRHRLGVLQQLRADKTGKVLPALFVFYRDNPVQFIIDWGCTFEQRNAAKGLPVVLPFYPFLRQLEWFDWVLTLMSAGEDGVNDKSRDVGASWMAVSLSCTLCLFRENFTVGFGSRKEEYVDKLDSPKSLFYKARRFMALLPAEFRRGWDEKNDAPHMRIKFPGTSAVMTGEAGDNIGRGDRAALYFVDEAAHLERPELVEASLSMTTNCRIDMSSVNGRQNPFALKRFKFPAHRVFTFHWRDDPRKDDAWYAKECEDTPLPSIIAQELDINYDSSARGIIIPQEWVQAAIDAHVTLGFEPTGERVGALDIADEGVDLNAFAGRHGVVLQYLDAWSGKGSDIFSTVERAVNICDSERIRRFSYDSDGLGAGARGDARTINEQREKKGLPPVEAEAFRGSEAVVNPDDPIPDTVDRKDRINKDYFLNRKAQGWGALRLRFLRTYRAVRQGHAFNPDDLISLSSKMPRLQELAMQLSQPTWEPNGAGKMIVDKAPEGSKSPNDADAVMILYAPAERKPRSFFD